jgi:tetratricopeptide (TPR) repeat protein
MNPKRLFVLIAVVVGLSLPVLSFDYGITEDEQLHHKHGETILDYFLGRSELATRHPLDADGDLTFSYGPDMRDLSGALNIYGGVFDLLCVATHRYLSPFGVFETRHLVNSWFGVLLIVFGGLTAAQIAGWRAGVLGLLLLAASPRILGHSMNNPVDLPFAALYLCSIYFALRVVEQLPRPKPGAWIPLLIGIALATDVRIAGLVLLFYLVLFAGVWHAPRVFDRERARRFLRSMGVVVLLAVAAYLLVSVAWPLAHRNPLTTPLMAYSHLTRLEFFTALDLFEGRWIDRLEIPWYFALKWLIIGTPLFVPLGLLLLPPAFGLRSAGPPAPAAIDRRKLSMVAFTFLFPMLFVILRHSNVYNDARHVLFAYPPLAVSCAVAFELVWRRIERRVLKVALAVALCATIIEPLSFIARNHPNAGIYFSPLIGGVDGAWKRYETDFWGNSVRQAVEWIQDNVEPDRSRPVRVRNWYGDQTKTSYYASKRPGYEFVIADNFSDGWDYTILQTVQCKYSPEILEQWPPKGTVFEVKADDTPLSAVLVNYLYIDPDDALERMTAWAERNPTHGYWHALGIAAFELERYETARESLERALQLDPANPLTWDEIASTYGRLDRWADQIDASREALRIDPTLEAARDNFRWALLRRNEPAPEPQGTGLTFDESIELGLRRYDEGEFEAAAAAFRGALRSDPVSPLAYNNLCSAYNALGRWPEAIDACETALALQPDFPRARNNLAQARAAAAAPGTGGG